MRLHIVGVILRKELRETLRDRRTLLRLFLLPILLYPLFALAVSKLQGAATEARELRPSRIAVWGELPAALERTLRDGEEKLVVEAWTGAPPGVRSGLAAGSLSPPLEPERKGHRDPDAPAWSEPDNPVLDAARSAIASRLVDAVLVPSPTFAQAFDADARGSLAVYFDSVREDSRSAEERVDRALGAARRELVAARESRHALPRGFAGGFDVLERNVAPPRRRIGQILGAFMPMMLIMTSLLGCFLPAIDLTAGEKERGTMQTLLCAPVRSIEIIWGKFLAVFVIALITALANVVSLAFTLRRIVGGDLHVPLSVHALTFTLLVPVTFLFSAVFLALAVFAKDFKDGQNVLMPVYLPITLLAGVTALPGIELDPWTAFAPVMNVALLIKALFLGETPAELIFLTLASSALYAALALVLAARVFEREHVLLGGRESARSLLGLERHAGGTPTAGFSLAAFAVIEVLFFYGSLLLASAAVMVQLVATQLGFFLATVVACVVLFGYSARDTLALRLPPARGLAAAIVLGGSAWAVAVGLCFRVAPPPEALTRELEKLVFLDGQPLWVLVLLVAVLPAVCEELVFRGLIFSGLRRLGVTPAVVLSALLFGLAHGSVYRLLPTAVLGLALAFTRERTGSILPGMVLHALHNGLAVTLVYLKPPWAAGLLEGGTLPWSVTLGGTAVFCAGVALMRSTSPAGPAPGRLERPAIG